MRLEQNQPAKTYDINVLSSALGRCYIDSLSETDIQDIIELSEAALKLLAEDKPLVPHSDPVLIQNFVAQLTRLGELSKSPTVKNTLGDALANDVGMTIQSMTEDITTAKRDPKYKSSPKEIATMFGMSNMWDSALEVAEQELQDKNSQTRHPLIPEGFAHLVSQNETRRLIECVIRDIFHMDSPISLCDSIVSNAQGHHLFWTTRENNIQYITPENYDLATQFSFDIPHNAGHIAHLAAHETLGVHTFIDDMEKRAYFESIAVLSEHYLISQLQHNPSLISSIHAVLNKNRNVGPDELREWIIADRIFEARLRAARLLADCFTLEGFAFDEVVQLVASKTGLSQIEAGNETSKYYTLTGLGAVYVLGPRQLMEQGVLNPRNAIIGQNSRVLRTWRDFNRQHI